MARKLDPLTAEDSVRSSSLASRTPLWCAPRQSGDFAALIPPSIPPSKQSLSRLLNQQTVSRLRLSCDAFKNTNHLIILNLIFLVVSSIPRLESVVVVKLQELFAVCLAFNKYELASNQVLRST